MGYIYDQSVIYGGTKSNYNSFQLNGYTYYTTKTGITKRRKGLEKAIKVNSDEYEAAWKKYDDIFN